METSGPALYYFHFKVTITYFFIINETGLLIFRVVAEPRNLGKSAKSREIHKDTKNASKFSRNLIKYMSVQHIRNLFQLLDLFTCRKLANLSQNFVTETCKQHPKTTRCRLCCEKLGTSHQRAKKVLSDSPGLVDFAIRLVNSVFNLPDGQVMFYEEYE